MPADRKPTRSLRIHPLRTMLSVLGIIIGAGSFVATMSVRDGLMGFARGQIERETSVQVVSIGSRTSDYQQGPWISISNYPVFTLDDAGGAAGNLARPNR